MTTVSIWVVVGVVAVGIIAAIAIVRWAMRRHALSRPSPPPLFYPVRPYDPANATTADARAALVRPNLPRNGVTHANGASSANGATPRVNGTARANTKAPEAEVAIPRVAADRPRAQADRVLPPPSNELRDGETIRFYRPSEQALQLLPGHLEVLSGTMREREIRFVRVPGESPHVLLGRDPGPSPSMIGLGSSTVSRQHARLDYVDGHWRVKNLSRTNPLVVNDNQLDESAGDRLLSEGDRLELGEVVLRFHEH